MGAPAVCLYVIFQKVLISENHKAQTLSAEANSYVKTRNVVLLGYNNSLLMMVAPPIMERNDM